MSSFMWLEQAKQDLRFAIRALCIEPSFALSAVLILALGLGASSSIFTLLRSTLFRSLPYHDPSRLVSLIENVRAEESFTGQATSVPALSPTDVQELRQRSKTLSAIALYLPGSMVFSGRSAAQVVPVAQISPSLLPLLGRNPRLGRAFEKREGMPGADRVVLLSHRAWIQYFGADPRILTRSVRLDDVVYSVIGVMPSDFAFPDSQTVFWKPLVSANVTTGQLTVFPVLARIMFPFSLATASVEVNQVFGQIRGDKPAVNRTASSPRIELLPLQEAQSAVSRPALLVLSVAVGLVLLIACANVSNLLLARLTSRQQELATRASLGAGWSRLVRQVFTESLLLSCLGGLLSIPITIVVGRILFVQWPSNTSFASTVPRLDRLDIDLPTLLFTLSLAIFTGFALGVIPALHLFRTDHMESLKRGNARAFSGLRMPRGHSGLGALVILETGLAFMLLIGAGLLMHSFLELAHVDPGFDPRDILTFQVASPPTTARASFNAEFAEQLRELPGVQAAGFGELLPLELDSMLIRPLQVDGMIGPPMRQAIQPRTLEGSWNYLSAVGFRLLQGRWFQNSDGPGKRQVMLVNQAFARYYFGTQNPLGRTVSSLGKNPWEIIGVVKDVRQQGLTSHPEPQFFLEYRQMQHANPGWDTGLDHLFSLNLYFAVRTADNPSKLIPHIRQMITRMDKNAVMNNTASLEHVVAHTLGVPAFFAALVAVFSALALVLATLGIYGVMGYTVARRTQEIGIRMALGGSRAQILHLVLGQAARLVTSGILFGLAGSLLLTRSLRVLLFGVTPLDWPTFVIVPVLFALVAFVASYLPARRASQVDPVLSLREH